MAHRRRIEGGEIFVTSVTGCRCWNVVGWLAERVSAVVAGNAATSNDACVVEDTGGPGSG